MARTNSKAGSVTKRTRGGRTVYLAQVYVKAFKRSSKQFDDRKAAEAWASTEEAALRKLKQAGDALSPDAAGVTIKDLVERFLRDPKVKQASYYPDLERLLASWVERYGDRKGRAFGAVQVIDMRDSLLAGRKSATVNRYVSAMRRCWHWGQEVGLIERAAGWPSGVMLGEPRGRVRYLNDNELSALIKAARGYSATMHAAVVVSLATGIRQGELLRLEWKDLDFGKSRLTVLESKNDEPRTIHLPANAAAVLRDLKKATVVGKHVFLLPNGSPFYKDALAYHWRELRAKAGLKDFRWHDLRHSCASYPTSVYPHSFGKARYILRVHRNELMQHGALVRVGRELVVIGSRYEKWLQKQAARVPGYECNANGGAP